MWTMQDLEKVINKLSKYFPLGLFWDFSHIHCEVIISFFRVELFKAKSNQVWPETLIWTTYYCKSTHPIKSEKSTKMCYVTWKKRIPSTLTSYEALQLDPKYPSLRYVATVFCYRYRKWNAFFVSYFCCILMKSSHVSVEKNLMVDSWARLLSYVTKKQGWVHSLCIF